MGQAREPELSLLDLAMLQGWTLIDAFPVLDHEVVVGGLARAYDPHGIEVPGRRVITIDNS